MLTKGSSSPPPAAHPPCPRPRLPQLSPGAWSRRRRSRPTYVESQSSRRRIRSGPSSFTNAAASSAGLKFAHGPAVRAKHFVTKNPFKAQLGAPAQTAAAAPLATPPHVTPASSSQHTSSATKAPARIHRDPALARQPGIRGTGGQEGARTRADRCLDPVLVEVHVAPARLLGPLPEQVFVDGGCELGAPARTRQRIRISLPSADQEVRYE